MHLPDSQDFSLELRCEGNRCGGQKPSPSLRDTSPRGRGKSSSLCFCLSSLNAFFKVDKEARTLSVKIFDFASFSSGNGHPFVCFADISPIRGITQRERQELCSLFMFCNKKPLPEGEASVHLFVYVHITTLLYIYVEKQKSCHKRDSLIFKF